MAGLDEQFDTGLQRVLDGIQVHIESRSESERGTKSARTRRR
jgi:hypothetical protein